VFFSCGKLNVVLDSYQTRKVGDMQDKNSILVSTGKICLCCGGRGNHIQKEHYMETLDNYAGLDHITIPMGPASTSQVETIRFICPTCGFNPSFVRIDGSEMYNEEDEKRLFKILKDTYPAKLSMFDDRVDLFKKDHNREFVLFGLTTLVAPGSVRVKKSKDDKLFAFGENPYWLQERKVVISWSGTKWISISERESAAAGGMKNKPVDNDEPLPEEAVPMMEFYIQGDRYTESFFIGKNFLEE
jgi:hypothetical protein